MDGNSIELLLVSDHNLSNFASVFKGFAGGRFTVMMAPLDQVVPTLHQAHPLGRHAMVWTMPERVSSGFQQARAFGTVEAQLVLEEVDRFADSIRTAATSLHTIYLPLWQIDPAERYGNHELHADHGVHALLMRMNLRLCERVSDLSNVHVMHGQRWTQKAGPGAWSQRLWFMTKTPFSNDVYQAAAKDLLALADAARGHRVKLIVLDLDDTLWGGIVGDDGWENLRLGGHDALGESFVTFQRTLRSLKDRGILLAIASKNDHRVALEAINNHPEMVLKEGDFVAMRINWQDKAGNIAEMVNELNIGLSSVLFVDDNPVERARVKAFLPDVMVPDWPANKLLYDQFIRTLPGLDTGVLSAEDTIRTRLYAEERARERSKSDTSDVNTWMRSLEMRVEAGPVSEADHVRVHQLFGKTNQFNLTTRRLSDTELRTLRAHPDHAVWSFRVSDRFGDAGLTGVLGMDLSHPHVAVISDMILSCRVMGRMVEETILHVAHGIAKNAGRSTLVVNYHPTSKNRPILEFLERSGLERSSEHQFTWDVAKDLPCPDTLHLMIPHTTR